MSKGTLMSWIFLATMATVFVVSLDFTQVRPIWQQYHSSNFPPVEATVLGNGITKYRGSKGSTSYGIEVTYRYSIDNHTFTSSQTRYIAEKWHDRESAKRALSAFSVGSKITAYVNPKDTSDALIDRAVSNYDLMRATTILPLMNLIAIFLWMTPLQEIIISVRRLPAGGVLISEKMLRTHVRLATMTPFSSALVAAMAGFPITSAIGMITDFHPLFRTIVVAWLLIFVLIISVFVWQKIRLSTGIQDLVIDDNSGLLTLPANGGRKENITVARNDVVAVSVLESTVRTSKGGRRTQFSPTLKTKDADGEAEYQLIAWGSEKKAVLFTEWLAQKLGVPFPGIEEKTPHLHQEVMVRKPLKYRF